ncbi:MAG: hypothetical protein K1X35_05975 [Caulobacteraceae bacterium]|nr:hypothetical protein [Caulobacteraceae bacterium]
MRLNADVEAGLRRLLPAGRRFRICLRDAGGTLLVSNETDSPLEALAGIAEDATFYDLRVEVADAAGEFHTLSPYALLEPGPGPVSLDGPSDPEGRPVRLMIYDEAARSYVLDRAVFGTRFHVDPDRLGSPGPFRYRFYLWSHTGEWRPQGYARLLVWPADRAEEHDPRLPEIEALLDRRLGAHWRGSDALLEFLSDRAVVADAPADDPVQIRRALALALAGSPISDLRVRLLTRKPDGGALAGPIQAVAGARPLFDALLAGIEGDPAGLEEARGILLYRPEDETPRTRSAIAAFLYRALPEGAFRNPQAFRLDLAEPLYAAWRATPEGSALVGDALDALRHYDVPRRETLRQGVAGGSFFQSEHLTAIVEPALAAAARLPGADAGSYVARLLRAKLASLRSRAEAAVLFEDLRNQEHRFRTVSDFDNGVATYFSAEHLAARAPVLEARRAALIASLEIRSAPPAESATPVFLFSADPRFLAIYLPYWLGMAEYCKARSMDFHVVLNAAPAEADAVLRRVGALRDSLAELRGGDPARYADNLTFSVCPVPDWCRAPLSFYACSRFLLLGELTRRFRREILVQDIDFSLVKDPAAFLRQFPGPGIGIHASEGMFGLDPWRRIMGGGFSAPDDDQARASLRRLEHYLLEGLGEANSWYLDQNALAYFVEQVRAAPEANPALFNLNQDRATAQLRANKLMEASQGPLPYLDPEGDRLTLSPGSSGG